MVRKVPKRQKSKPNAFFNFSNLIASFQYIKCAEKGKKRDKKGQKGTKMVRKVPKRQKSKPNSFSNFSNLIETKTKTKNVNKQLIFQGKTGNSAIFLRETWTKMSKNQILVGHVLSNLENWTFGLFLTFRIFLTVLIF